MCYTGRNIQNISFNPANERLIWWLRSWKLSGKMLQTKEMSLNTDVCVACLQRWALWPLMGPSTLLAPPFHYLSANTNPHWNIVSFGLHYVFTPRVATFLSDKRDTCIASITWTESVWSMGRPQVKIKIKKYFTLEATTLEVGWNSHNTPIQDGNCF